MAIFYRLEAIVYRFRLAVEVFAMNDVVGVVDIELEIAHNCQVVPEFVAIVLHIAQFGEHITHDLYYCEGATSAFLAVLNCHAVVNHLLYVSAVFRQYQLLKL